MTFKLQIKLGNAEMLTGTNVAGALHEVAHLIDEPVDLAESDPYDRSGRIMDSNGNSVGTWEVK